MSHDHHNEPFPRIPLMLCGTAVLISLGVAAVGRMTDFGYVTPTAAPVISRELIFHDQPNGAVAVYDARDRAQPIEILAPETNYFIRATMRGFAQQRLRQDASRDTPFRLTQWADNRLTLEDPVTHRTAEMEAFGISNESVFATLLTARAPGEKSGS